MQNQTPKNTTFYKTWIFWAVIYGLLILGYSLAFIFLDPEKKVLLTSNELGDFLAGVFAPLAFLFLFLGYIQQGAALRKSNEKLSEQLEQQARLISIQEDELNAKHFSVRPHLSYKSKGISVQSFQRAIYENDIAVDVDDEVNLCLDIDFIITCESGTAKFIKVIDTYHDAVITEIVEIEKGQFKLISFMLHEEEIIELMTKNNKDSELSLILAIEYFDIYGKQFNQKLKLMVPNFDWSKELYLQLKILNSQTQHLRPTQTS